MSYYLRVWQACDVAEISKHMMILGDLTADCVSCRELGIDYTQVKICPGCGTDFKFIALRNAGWIGGAVKRVKERRPDLTIIDYGDYKEVTGKQQARDLFGK